MAKYDGRFKRGMHVHVKRFNYPNDFREVDFKTLYSVRNIGDKKAVLDKIDPQTCKKVPGWRGQSFYTSDTENWNSLFFPAPKAGWDPEINA